MRVRHVGYSLEEPARSGLESLLSGTGSGLRRGVALASGQGGGMVPEIRYVKSDGVHIAYQMLGDGPIDLVFVSGFTSHAEHQWEEPSVARFLLRLASFSRLIWFDKRGTGLSDQVPANEHFLDLRMEDLIAVLDGVGAERVALLGASEGGPTCILFAATSPERVSHLVLYATWARFLQDVDYPIGVPQESAEPMLEMLSGLWARARALPSSRRASPATPDSRTGGRSGSGCRRARGRRPCCSGSPPRPTFGTSWPQSGSRPLSCIAPATRPPRWRTDATSPSTSLEQHMWSSLE